MVNSVQPVRMRSSIDCTRTSVSGWLSLPQPVDGPVMLEVTVGGVVQRPVRAHRAVESDEPGRRFDLQWLQPVAPGDKVVVRLAGTAVCVAAAPIGTRAAKHAMFSPKFSYAIYYNPKSACTSLRRLFVELHADEVEGDDVPSVNHAPTVFPLRGAGDHPAIHVVRHPQTRVVSAFIDKVVSRYYAPQLCTGDDVYRWRFGADQSLWGGLTFMDFLAYLGENRHCADIHFQVQPAIDGNVETVRVEKLAAELEFAYGRHVPELAERVRQFLASPDARSNLSLHTTNVVRQALPNAHLMTAAELGRLLQDGIGFESRDFISVDTTAEMTKFLRDEAEAHGYTLGVLE